MRGATNLITNTHLLRLSTSSSTCWSTQNKQVCVGYRLSLWRGSPSHCHSLSVIHVLITALITIIIRDRPSHNTDILITAVLLPDGRTFIYYAKLFPDNSKSNLRTWMKYSRWVIAHIVLNAGSLFAIWWIETSLSTISNIWSCLIAEFCIVE